MKTVLKEMVRQIRGFTRQLLNATDPEWVLFAPAGTSNHMLWHAGHAIWVQDKLCVQRLVGKSELPGEWGAKFGMDCQSVAKQKDWPTLHLVQQMLAGQETRLLDLLDKMTPEQLVVDPANDKDLVGGIIHGLHDEAKHQGEMYLLHKLCASQPNVKSN